MRKLIAITTLFSGCFTGLAIAKEPLHVVVSLDEQRLWVYEGAKEISRSNVSSGKAGHRTPTGIFSILQKRRHHRSNIYNNAPMPFMQRLTWTGIALHASGSVPRRPASHGCVRLPHGFARKLFGLTTRGAHVTIERNPQKPTLFTHPNLFQPAKVWRASAEFDPWVNQNIEARNPGAEENDDDAPVRIYLTRRTQAEDVKDSQRILNKLGYGAGDVDGFMGPATAKAIKWYQRSHGLKENGLISGDLMARLFASAREEAPKNGRLLVRKNFKPVYETGVEIKDPQYPLGSHLITASEFDAEALSTKWLSVSLEDQVYRQVNLPGGVKIEEGTDRYLLADALNRIVIDDEARRKVSQMLVPLSSISISDNGLSGETATKGTDFVVITRPGKAKNTVKLKKKKKKSQNS